MIQLVVLFQVPTKMKPRNNGVPRSQKAQTVQAEGPNWILIVGGALLSTLSIRLGYKLMQTLDSKPQTNTSNGKGQSSDRSVKEYMFECLWQPGGRLVATCIQTSIPLHEKIMDASIAFLVWENSKATDDLFSVVHLGLAFNANVNKGIGDLKRTSNDQMLSESDTSLPLVTVPASEFTKENGVMWVSSPDRLELPPKPFHHSVCSDSPCVSESGSDIFNKREVIQKLRQQLKRRDDMIMEMLDQITELQNSLSAQLVHSTNVQSQLDAANRDLVDSQREIQMLRKAIADRCVKHVGINEMRQAATTWPSEARNGHASGYLDGGCNFESSEKGRVDVERIEILRREVGELKEVVDGKDYLLQSYKEQKAELWMKIRELQQRLDSQLPNIL